MTTTPASKTDGSGSAPFRSSTGRALAARPVAASSAGVGPPHMLSLDQGDRSIDALPGRPSETNAPEVRAGATPVPALSRRASWSAGQPISQLMQMALANPQLISLAAGFVDNASLPVEATQQAVEHLLSRSTTARSALQYGAAAGYLPLREQVLAMLQRADAAAGRAGSHPTTPENVVVGAGSNELLHLLVDTLCDPGDVILCASPTYFVFLGVAANMGVRTWGVAADRGGLIPEALDEALQMLDRAGELARVKAIYVTSYFDNPASVSLAKERRPQIVELARRWSQKQRIFVIEDAAYRDLRYGGPDLPSLHSCDDHGDTVIYAGTFSKSFAPGLRVGYGVLPTSLVGPVLDQKGNVDFGSPHFSQQVMSAVIELGLLTPHIERLRNAYRVKRDAMLAAADEHLTNVPGAKWERPDGGLYVWLTLPAGVETAIGSPLYQSAVGQGVLYVPGHYCYPREGFPVERHAMRLSYGVQDPAGIAAGVASLAKAALWALERPRARKETEK